MTDSHHFDLNMITQLQIKGKQFCRKWQNLHNFCYQRIQKTHPPKQVRFGARGGTCRLLRLRLASYSLSDRGTQSHSTRFALFTKNSPPDCFIYAQTLSGSSPNK